MGNIDDIIFLAQAFTYTLVNTIIKIVAAKLCEESALI